MVNISFRGASPSRCLGSDDLNGDGVTNAQDVVGMVNIAFRGQAAVTPFRVYSLIGRSGPGSSTLIADDSIQYLIQGVYSVGLDSVPPNPPVPLASCDKTDTLRIQAGTKVWGDTGAVVSAIIVRRHGYIHSVGTETQPILFTSRLAPGTRNRGDWGGFVLNGCDSCNDASGQFVSEGNGGIGGGFDSGDNSGCIIYTVQEFSGHVFAVANELNGMTLNGVGRGTTIHHVQVNQNLDDGIEWFGGTVNVKYAVVSGCDDDKFDTDLGAQFKAQFLLAVEDTTKGSSADHEGLEQDNRPGTPYNLTPVVYPMIANYTYIGQGYDYGTKNVGMHARRGHQGEVYNTLFLRVRRGNDIDREDGTSTTMSGTSGIFNTIWYDISQFNEDADAFDPLFNVAGAPYFNSVNINPNVPNPGLPMANILVGPTGYTDAGFTSGAGDFRPLAGSLPMTWISSSGSTVVLPAGFDPSGNGFVGCIDANDPDPWYDVWTSWAQF
jgi:hypothetical protein